MSWNQLLSIYQAAEQQYQLYRTQRPSACPHDGEPLETGQHGELHCRYDGWIWDGRPVDYDR